MLESPSPCTILCFLFRNCDGINYSDASQMIGMLLNVVHGKIQKS